MFIHGKRDKTTRADRWMVKFGHSEEITSNSVPDHDLPTSSNNIRPAANQTFEAFLITCKFT